MSVNEQKVSRYTPGILGLRTRGGSESVILIFGWVLAWTWSGVNKITVDFGADINSALIRKKRDNLSNRFCPCAPVPEF